MNTDQIVAILNSTPYLLKGWLQYLPQNVLLQSDKKGTWHSVDVLKHLIYGEQIDWIPRLRLMLKENANGKTPTFETFDRTGHTQNNKTDIAQLLSEFQQLRTENLKTLQLLSKEYNLLKLQGIHPELGTVNGAQLVSTWVVHDQTHIYQIARNIAASYANDVGPWAAYLRIIQKQCNE